MKRVAPKFTIGVYIYKLPSCSSSLSALKVSMAPAVSPFLGCPSLSPSLTPPLSAGPFRQPGLAVLSAAAPFPCIALLYQTC